jgi:hypothetical protein
MEPSSMMTNLSWSVVMFAILAGLACWNPEGRTGCEASRPLFGKWSCCEKHKAASSKAEFETVADLEAARRAEDAAK